MAGHLLDAGFAAAGYDIDPARLRAFEAAGGTPCASPREVATAASTVVTSLPSAGALRSALSDDDGLLADLSPDDRSTAPPPAASPGLARSVYSYGRPSTYTSTQNANASAAEATRLVIVETSTLALDDKESARAEAESAGAVLLDCPLSGTAGQALTKDLVVYASGDPTAVERCAPVFAGFARDHFYLGPFGAGSKMKFVANLLVAVHNVAAAEAFVLARKAGIDPQTVYEVIASGAGSSRMFEVRGPMMVAGDYDQPGIAGRVFQKDLRIIADFASSLDCPTPLFTTATQLYVAALAHGLGDQDAAAVHAALEHLAGLDAPQS